MFDERLHPGFVVDHDRGHSFGRSHDGNDRQRQIPPHECHFLFRRHEVAEYAFEKDDAVDAGPVRQSVDDALFAVCVGGRVGYFPRIDDYADPAFLRGVEDSRPECAW
jgi:hypothetical protein